MEARRYEMAWSWTQRLGSRARILTFWSVTVSSSAFPPHCQHSLWFGLLYVLKIFWPISLMGNAHLVAAFQILNRFQRNIHNGIYFLVYPLRSTSIYVLMFFPPQARARHRAQLADVPRWWQGTSPWDVGERRTNTQEQAPSQGKEPRLCEIKSKRPRQTIGIQAQRMGSAFWEAND